LKTPPSSITLRSRQVRPRSRAAGGRPWGGAVRMGPLTNSMTVKTKRPRARATLAALVETLRPHQWVKNGFVFAALIFSRSLTRGDRCLKVTLAALVFTLAAGAGYALNDILDAADDRQHPIKKLRPIAAGRLRPATAGAGAAVLAAAALAAAARLDRGFLLAVAAYLALNLVYSSILKRIVLLDVFMVAAGFLLRVIGGGVVIHVAISSWLIVCTTLLALFLALTKRRHELVLLGDRAPEHRASLAEYTPYFLDQLIAIVTAATLVSYILYTLSPDVQAKFPGKRLELTVPFVLFGVFRYLYLVHRREEGGSPAQALFTDPVLLGVVLLWAASVVLLIYL